MKKLEVKTIERKYPYFMDTASAARAFSVNVRRLRLWCTTGKIKAYRPFGGKRWLIRPEELEAFLMGEENRSTVNPRLEKVLGRGR